MFSVHALPLSFSAISARVCTCLSSFCSVDSSSFFFSISNCNLKHRCHFKDKFLQFRIANNDKPPFMLRFNQKTFHNRALLSCSSLFITARLSIFCTLLPVGDPKLQSFFKKFPYFLLNKPRGFVLQASDFLGELVLTALKL